MSHPAEYPDFEDVLDSLLIEDGVKTYQENIALIGSKVFDIDPVTFAERWDQMLSYLRHKDDWK